MFKWSSLRPGTGYHFSTIRKKQLYTGLTAVAHYCMNAVPAERFMAWPPGASGPPSPDRYSAPVSRPVWAPSLMIGMYMAARRSTA